MVSVKVLARLAAVSLGLCSATNTRYANPILPGFNPDPSCAFVSDWNNTVFCTTSSFLTFPGAPVFASRDLVNWKLASHALSRSDQLPELNRNSRQQDGLWAPTIRYRDGVLYLITSYVSYYGGWSSKILLFSTTNPYDDAAWRGPVHMDNPTNSIDPDLFWDDDGTVYIALAGGPINKVNISTGAVTETFRAWNGTGGSYPEGPHLYKRGGYYYLMIGEGGTEVNHTATIARSRDIRGPWESYKGNPILTAKGTDEFFQTVGHADFFQDARGKWWGVALSTRSGPEWKVYPMGRETVLYPMTWDEGEWPAPEQVRGLMDGPLPPRDRDVPGDGPWADDGDKEDFAPGSALGRSFLFWRPPKTSLFSVSPPGHPHTLRISPSRVNLTADKSFEPSVDGMAFVSRKQSSSVFDYSIDLSFTPKTLEEEAGVTVFLTQFQHIDLGVVNLPAGAPGSSLAPKLRFRVEASGKPGAVVPATKTVTIPPSWLDRPIRLSIRSTKDACYVFSAAPAGCPEEEMVLGTASAYIVSGGTGPFHGSLIGAYATRNGGNGSTPAYVSRWRYTPLLQQVDFDKFVRAT